MVKDEMPSDRVAQILRSKSSLSQAEIEKLNDAEGWRLIYSLKSSSRPDDRTEVCFTGFSAGERDDLMNLASSAGMHVVKSVTTNLRILCAGATAGPKKLEKARANSVAVLSELQFRRLLETGEMPEEA